MILWLASYPKSGNTWIRLLLANYLYPETNNIFENLIKIPRFPNIKQFSGIVNLDNLDHRTEIIKYFIDAQDKINLNNETNIIKTHNCGCAINDYEFTNDQNTCGFIYIVRDPRSVAVSYAHHTKISLEKSVNNIISEKYIGINDEKLVEFRSSWRINYLSWIKAPYPKLIIKYEDMLNDTVGSFKKILEFVNKFKRIEINMEKIKKTVELCQFNNLKSQENKFGFKEDTFKVGFFRKGIEDEWKTKLNDEQAKKIELFFNKEMKELKYI